VDEYGDSVYKFCRSITYSKEDAEDLFQDTYLKAFSQISKVAQAENPLGFLLSTAAYLQKSVKRKFARRNRIAPTTELFGETDNEPAALTAEDEYLAVEETRIVRKLVNSLSDKYKLPVILYYTVGMNVPDIAQTLKTPVGTIKSRLFKAREIIRKGLEAEYGNE
jgi:RNA polymerase sigma-70 factor (ECF subfamily)